MTCIKSQLLACADGYDTAQLMEALLSSISKESESLDALEEDLAAKIASKKVYAKVRMLRNFTPDLRSITAGLHLCILIPLTSHVFLFMPPLIQIQGEALFKRKTALHEILFTVPSKPEAGRPVEVYYNPELTSLRGRPDIYLHGSWNRWQTPESLYSIQVNSQISILIRLYILC